MTKSRSERSDLTKKRFHGLIDPKITRKSKNKICQMTESRTECSDLSEKKNIFSIIFIQRSQPRQEQVSKQKIYQMTESKTECNDLTEKKQMPPLV